MFFDDMKTTASPIIENASPCPWCGRKPYIKKYEVMVNYRICCSNPNCPIESFIHSTKEDALVWWNSWEKQLKGGGSPAAHNKERKRN